MEGRTADNNAGSSETSRKMFRGRIVAMLPVKGDDLDSLHLSMLGIWCNVPIFIWKTCSPLLVGKWRVWPKNIAEGQTPTSGNIGVTRP